MYVPVKKIANYLGYKAYNGEYQAKSEEPNQCYVISDNEVANLSLNSERIYKLDLEEESSDYQYYDISEKVKAIDRRIIYKF